MKGFLVTRECRWNLGKKTRRSSGTLPGYAGMRFETSYDGPQLGQQHR